jgi:hypothetical protein
MAGASIPELADHPVMTERLRALLTRRYQFLQSRTVTIVDPAAGIDVATVRGAIRDGRELAHALVLAQRLQRALSRELSERPDAREGVSEQVSMERRPYTLTKSWARSVSQLLRDRHPFGRVAWPSVTTETSAADIAARVLEGEIRSPRDAKVSIDVGFDVSRSMMIDGRVEYAYLQAVSLLGRLQAAFSSLTWRLWTVSDDTRLAAEGTSPYEKHPLETVLRRTGVRAGETRFAPFMRTVRDHTPASGGHLCVLVTDGECSDRPETLRWAERLHACGTDYLQVILHRDDDHRRYVRSPSGSRPVDNVLTDDELRRVDRLITRTDAELHTATADHLRRVTDIAEAAHGAQIVLTYLPLFALVTLDVYERYSGELLARE